MTGGWLDVGAAPVVVTVGIVVVAAARGVWSPCGLSMVSAINPMSEHSRGNRYWITACWFIAGSLIGGAVLGGIGALGAAFIGMIPVTSSVTLLLAALSCLICRLSDSGSVAFRLPGHPRQVNERWLSDYRRWAYACGFGVQIGFGFATYIMTAAVYLVTALGALSGSPLLASAVGVCFGAIRGIGVWLTFRVRDSAALFDLHRRLDRLAPTSLGVAMAAEACAAVAFAVAALGAIGGLVAAVAVLIVMAREQVKGRTHLLAGGGGSR
jgi:MFS family permease